MTCKIIKYSTVKESFEPEVPGVKNAHEFIPYFTSFLLVLIQPSVLLCFGVNSHGTESLCFIPNRTTGENSCSH